MEKLERINGEGSFLTPGSQETVRSFILKNSDVFGGELSTVRCGKLLGIAPSTVSYYIKKLERTEAQGKPHTLKSRGRRLTDEERQRANNIVFTNHTAFGGTWGSKHCAKYANVSEWYVRKLIKNIAENEQQKAVAPTEPPKMESTFKMVSATQTFNYKSAESFAKHCAEMGNANYRCSDIVPTKDKNGILDGITATYSLISE